MANSNHFKTNFDNFILFHYYLQLKYSYLRNNLFEVEFENFKVCYFIKFNYLHYFLNVFEYGLEKYRLKNFIVLIKNLHHFLNNFITDFFNQSYYFSF